MTKTVSDRSQRGGALLMVLWAALLISAILASVVATTRFGVHIAIAEVESIKAHEAARAGLEAAAFSIESGRNNTIDDREFEAISLNGYEVSVEPSLESKKIDINLASEAVLTDFFILLGNERDDAQNLAARVADWRDADDLARPNGAERSDYATAQNGEQIGNRDFQSVKEMSLVLEMPTETLDCALPALTVLGDSGLPEAQFLNDLYGHSIALPNRVNSTRLGTSGRRLSIGQRYSLTTVARSDRGRTYKLTGLFRITGGDTPYEFIALYQSTIEPPQSECSAIKIE